MENFDRIYFVMNLKINTKGVQTKKKKKQTNGAQKKHITMHVPKKKGQGGGAGREKTKKHKRNTYVVYPLYCLPTGKELLLCTRTW